MATGSSVEEILLKAKDIYHIYNQGDVETVALKGVGLDIQKGSWTSIIGPSGSGKSTLLYILAGLIKPSSGLVAISGQDIARMNPKDSIGIRRQTIGVVLQRDNLHPLLTIRENIDLSLRIAGITLAHQADELLEQVVLKDRSNNFPQQLSGGEVQRAAIAVALACSPKVLLADELTGELDEATTMSVLDLLSNLQTTDGLTIVTITHNAVVAERAENQFMMHDGILKRIN